MIIYLNTFYLSVSSLFRYNAHSSLIIWLSVLLYIFFNDSLFFIFINFFESKDVLGKFVGIYVWLECFVYVVAAEKLKIFVKLLVCDLLTFVQEVVLEFI